jgi:hypothetical protein
MLSPGKVIMTAAIVAVTGWMVLTAWSWPFRAALFPLVVGIPVFVMAVVELALTLLGKVKGIEEESLGADFRLSDAIDQRLADQRTMHMALWIVAFFALILVVGFPIAAPLFFLLYLKFGAKESWGIAIGLAAVAWLSFYGLFVVLLNTPFEAGWLQVIAKNLLKS